MLLIIVIIFNTKNDLVNFIFVLGIKDTMNNNIKKKIPTLNIVTPIINQIVSDDSEDFENSYDSDSIDDGYYVELSIMCSKDEEYENFSCIFNFESENNYNFHANEGFEDIEFYIEESLSMNYPEWSYEYEWEEEHIYGKILPEDHEGIIIDII